MGIYSRAIRYLWRQKVKSFLLFGCFLIAWVMVLTCASTLLKARELQSSLEENTGSKVILSPSDPFSKEDIQLLSQQAGVLSMNTTSKITAEPLNFSPVFGPDGENTVTVWFIDDPAADGPFAQEQYRLLEGSFQGAAANEALGLSLGETIVLRDEQGQELRTEVTGLFTSGSERLQPEGIYTENRLENQFFLSASVGSALADHAGCCTVSLYTAQPEALARDLEGKLPGCSITASDKLLRTLTAPTRQVIRLAGMMLALTAAVAAAVISLLMSLWARSRQREFGILLALGYSKLCIFIQTWLESLIIMVPALLVSVALSRFLIPRLIPALLSQPEYRSFLSFSPKYSQLPALTAACCGALALCVGIADLPFLCKKPREILSKMEE